MNVSGGIQLGVQEFLLGKLLAADLNTTADQAITILSGTKQITKILVVNPTGSTTLAAGGIYTAASKGGVAMVAAAQVFSGLGANLTLDLTLAKNYTTVSTLYLSLTVAQGGACTADVYIYGKIL